MGERRGREGSFEYRFSSVHRGEPRYVTVGDTEYVQNEGGEEGHSDPYLLFRVVKNGSGESKFFVCSDP